MKLKKILALLTILLLTLTACKSTEEPVDDEKPLKLSDRVGTYKGNGTVNDVVNLYAIIKIKENGEVFAVLSLSENTAVENNLQASTPVLDAKSELTTFDLETIGNEAYRIIFENKTTLKLTATYSPNPPTTIILMKQ